MPSLRRSVTRSKSRSRRSAKRSRRSGRTQLRPASTILDELSMGTAPTVVSSMGAMHERNGVTTQTAKSYAPKRRYKIGMGTINKLICPPYKFRYDGFGFNTAFTTWNGITGGIAYDGDTGITNYGSDVLGKPAGVFKSLEWASGSQAWFESVALPVYKKMPNASIVSLVELIKKYKDVTTLGNAGIFAQNLDVDSFYSAVETSITASTINADPTIVINKLSPAFNICYHGGHQTHKFTNFGTIEVTLEVWELHPRQFMSGYKRNPRANVEYSHDNVWEDLLKDHVENTPVNNAFAPFDDKRAIDEIHDIGVRIDNDCRRIMFKYKVSKPKLVKIPPGGTFTYVMNIPAFKVSGGEFLEYLTRNGTLDGVDGSSRAAQRPSYVPKFTRILCGRMYGQKGFGLGTDGLKPDGNAGDSSYIKEVGYGGGRVGHTMTEYHSCNLMPYINPSNYSRVNYLDTANITQYVDAADTEVYTWDQGAGNDPQNTQNDITDMNTGN